MSLLFQSRAFLTYWLDAVGIHSLHSPFFYDLFSSVVARDPVIPAYDSPERLRKKMLADASLVTVTDLGSGSRINGKATRRISDIARVSLSPPRRSRLLDRLARHYKCKVIIELGTSLGINTLYLACDKNRKVATFEGSPEISTVAKENFRSAGAENIDLISGDIAETLPAYLTENAAIDMVFMDANHRYEPTMAYFEILKPVLHPASLVILDDIHYHPGMEKAWRELRNDKSVWGSADFFRTGILFFDPSLNKQHVVLQY
jgi:predicted O-methyltransferase YrrM